MGKCCGCVVARGIYILVAYVEIGEGEKRRVCCIHGVLKRWVALTNKSGKETELILVIN